MEVAKKYGMLMPGQSIVLRISILSNNVSGSGTLAEHGLSLFIETHNHKILFDTGQSNLFIKNAMITNCHLADAEIIILSHGHFDHGNGLTYLSDKTLVCHPGCFVRRYRATDNAYIGLNNNQSFYSDRFNLISSKEPYIISNDIIFLGEIPRVTEFESKTSSYIYEDGSPDYVIDDSSVAFITENGLFLITGCGHSGIVNTMIHAKKVTGINRIAGIMGGFHLKDNQEQIQETIRYLQAERVKHILPMHCTELPALSAFYETLRIKQVRTGDCFTF